MRSAVSCSRITVFSFNHAGWELAGQADIKTKIYFLKTYRLNCFSRFSINHLESHVEIAEALLFASLTNRKTETCNWIIRTTEKRVLSFFYTWQFSECDNWRKSDRNIDLFDTSYTWWKATDPMIICYSCRNQRKNKIYTFLRLYTMKRKL
jgi:hypothetical protein